MGSRQQQCLCRPAAALTLAAASASPAALATAGATLGGQQSATRFAILLEHLSLDTKRDPM